MNHFVCFLVKSSFMQPLATPDTAVLGLGVVYLQAELGQDKIKPRGRKTNLRIASFHFLQRCLSLQKMRLALLVLFSCISIASCQSLPLEKKLTSICNLILQEIEIRL